MKNLKITPQVALLIYVLLLGAYSYGIWQWAKYTIPIDQQIEINDLEKRLENCHWQLLDRNVEVKKLSNDTI